LAAKHKTLVKYLSALLCESSFDDSVSKQRWCNVVGWFAPIDQKTACRDFFHRIQDLFSQNFFHGFLSEHKAEHQLKQLWESTSNKQSYYVVRFSESDVGGFILTFIDYIGHIQHEKITNRNGMWYVEGICEEFDSWKKVKTAFKQVYAFVPAPLPPSLSLAHRYLVGGILASTSLRAPTRACLSGNASRTAAQPGHLLLDILLYLHPRCRPSPPPPSPHHPHHHHHFVSCIPLICETCAHCTIMK